MNTFVLMIALIYNYGNAPSLSSMTAEFSSKAACEEALKAIESGLAIRVQVATKGCYKK
jgi:small neutral amino acid transporter SnatA (MarC family)